MLENEIPVEKYKIINQKERKGLAANGFSEGREFC
jgi:hypothetical protein